MTRPHYSVANDYIADGFADDCEELIHRCSRVDILSYQTFCIYYKDMNFASIFQGRTSNSEIAELSEELLQVAKQYMVQDTSNFEESVAGLFLVYALMSLQPYPRFAHLRVTPPDRPALARLEQVARRARRLDVLYVLGAVLVRGPVHYHAAARERGFEGTMRKYVEGPCMEAAGRPKGVYYRQNEELDIIREMSAIFKKYSVAKEQIPGLKTRGLKYSNDNLADDLGTSLKRLINGITDEEATESSSHYNAVQEIKTRAMRGAVGAIRHLAPVALRSPEKTPQKNNETSPKTPSPKSRNPKRGVKSKPQAKKPKRMIMENSNSSSEEEIEEEFCTRKGKSPASTAFEKLDDETSEQKIRVELGCLPTIVTTDTEDKPSLSIPIEIEIDKTKSKKKCKKKTSDDAIFKRPSRVSPRIKALSKRDLKKPILKSKFKKMGMLNVANFEEK